MIRFKKKAYWRSIGRPSIDVEANTMLWSLVWPERYASYVKERVCFQRLVTCVSLMIADLV